MNSDLYEAEKRPYLIILSSKESPFEFIILDLNSFTSPDATISLKYSSHKTSNSSML